VKPGELYAATAKSNISEQSKHKSKIIQQKDKELAKKDEQIS
jgi:hypothetical protein